MRQNCFQSKDQKLQSSAKNYSNTLLEKHFQPTFTCSNRNGNSCEIRCEICLKLTVKTSSIFLLWTYFVHLILMFYCCWVCTNGEMKSKMDSNRKNMHPSSIKRNLKSDLTIYNLSFIWCPESTAKW